MIEIQPNSLLFIGNQIIDNSRLFDYSELRSEYLQLDLVSERYGYQTTQNGSTT